MTAGEEFAQAQRAKLASDPHRPQFHFLPPANWMNDPNGLIQWKGRYHLFYQYNPGGAFHGDIHWGHAVSDDLVHWQDQPVALRPTPGGLDEGGCWSGCIVNNEGRPTLFYTAVHPQVVCMATGDDELVRWRRSEANPLIERPPADIDAGDPWHFRDPYVWKEGETWYLIIGTQVIGKGGAILLYRSDDLLSWEYVGPLFAGDRRQHEPFWTATMWECPNLLRLDNRDLLIVSFQDLEARKLLYTGYFSGVYEDHRFESRAQGVLEYGGYSYAPQVMKDERGRHLLFTWLWEGRSEEAQRAAGWAGVMSLPRVLAVDEQGRLCMTPAPELRLLRDRYVAFRDLQVTPDGPHILHDVRGDTLEIEVEFAATTATRFGLAFRRSPDGEEETRLLYDVEQEVMWVDRRRSSAGSDAHRAVPDSHRQVERMPVAREDGKLHVQLFLDRSVVEAYVNERAVFSTRIYPSRPDSSGLRLLSEGGATGVSRLDVWRMKSIW